VSYLKLIKITPPHPFCSIIFPHTLVYNMHKIICSCIIINHSIPCINYHDVHIYIFSARAHYRALHIFISMAKIARHKGFLECSQNCKMRQLTVSCLSLCLFAWNHLSVCLHRTTWLPLDRFSGNLISENF
jgi:hypothetical protein